MAAIFFRLLSLTFLLRIWIEIASGYRMGDNGHGTTLQHTRVQSSDVHEHIRPPSKLSDEDYEIFSTHENIVEIDTKFHRFD